GWIGDRRRHVFVVPADGSEPARQLTDGDFEDGPPSWSPDGTRLVFAAGRHEDWDVEPFVDLYVVPASGGEPRPLTRTDAEYEAPAWSTTRTTSRSPSSTRRRASGACSPGRSTGTAARTRRSASRSGRPTRS